MTRRILRGDSKTCFPDTQLQHCNTDKDSSDASVQMHCEKSSIVYLFMARGAHDLETSAVLETGRTCKSAAVCALAVLSKRLLGRDP